MNDLPKLERLLKFILLLSGSRRYTIDELADRLEKTPRTIYRYIETVRESGLIINAENNFYWIDKKSRYFRDISSLVHFTEEEAWILNKAILALDDNSVVKSNLAQKLHSIYDLKGLPYPLVRKENSEKVVALIRAIQNKTIVQLDEYHSANSSIVSNRVVEPFEFTINYDYIWCYEICSKSCKLFKTARISKVIDTHKKWQFSHLHHTLPVDIFRNTGQTAVKVKLVLSMRAANLLLEEFPLSDDFIIQLQNKYLFDGVVYSYEGIGRFILGLPDEVEVIEPPTLKEWLNLKIRRKIF